MGYKLEEGICVPCPVGTRTGLWGQGFCIPCPEGMTTFGTASLQCGMFISLFLSKLIQQVDWEDNEYQIHLISMFQILCLFDHFSFVCHLTNRNISWNSSINDSVITFQIASLATTRRIGLTRVVLRDFRTDFNTNNYLALTNGVVSKEMNISSLINWHLMELLPPASKGWGR